MRRTPTQLGRAASTRAAAILPTSPPLCCIPPRPSAPPSRVRWPPPLPPWRSVKPNRTTYRTVIAALREAGALAEALSVYQSMRRCHPADNSEFEGLTAVAAERALTCEDAALRRAVADVCAIADPREVDLHGMSVLEARAAVLCTMALLQQGFRDSGGVPHDVTLITGRGRGSAGGEPVLRRHVFALLRELHLDLPEPPQAGDAAGGSGSRGGGNPGRIVIPRELIHQALTRKMLSRQAQQAEHGSSGPAEHGALEA